MPISAPHYTRPSREETIARHRVSLAYARAFGVGVGVFLMGWAPMNLSRWHGVTGAAGVFAHVESVLMVVYGVLLVVPYARVRSDKWFRRLFILLAGLSLAFIFLLVLDVMFVAVLAGEFDQKPPIPVLNSALVFLGVLQVPVVLFSRHPDWMD